MCSKKRGEIKAELIAAKDLSKDEIKKIEGNLLSTFDAKIKLNFKKDPSLIGGLIIQVNSTMIDTSIRSKLQKIEKLKEMKWVTGSKKYYRTKDKSLAYDKKLLLHVIIQVVRYRTILHFQFAKFVKKLLK